MDESEPQRGDYTVGWVCALPIEASAAQAMLDKEYRPLTSNNPHDSNVYVFGRVCNHNVVIASLPSGIYGESSAATTAKEMLLSFPNIRFGLLVGIGGGVPSEENDIRLGDVVVSKPEGKIGGVLQLDFGKVTNRGFERTGSLNNPPAVLLKAIAILESRHRLHGSGDVSEYILETHKKFPNFKAKHPGTEQDRLFDADYDHANPKAPTCQRCDINQLVDRDPRDTQNPTIHYGLIGSGNQVIKDSHARDLLQEENMLCVEMEAAGLMNEFPCLVIRGICDYCDSHKNKRWQPYAALAAAAYAKGLLNTIPILEVETAPAALDTIQETIVDMKQDLKEIVQQNQKHQKELARHNQHVLDDKIRNWLSPAEPWINYDRALRTRHSGSGTWFLNSREYSQWKSSPNSSLWLHGLPGCGKTVLTSSIIEDLQQEISPSPPASSDPILLCFFFDFREVKKQSLEELAISLVCQLYSKDRAFKEPLDSLLKMCDNGFRKPSTETLLGTFMKMLQTTSRKIYLVLDALDECAVPRQDLLEWLQKLVELSLQNVHLLVASRAELDIASVLRQANLMAQIVAVQSDIIDEDIRAYIIYRLQTDKEFNRWDHRKDIQQLIQESLMKMSDGMFRWAACQLDVLSQCVNPPSLHKALNTLPKTLDDTYSRILRSIPTEQKDDVIRLLQLLAYSDEPLDLNEAVDAIAVNVNVKPYFDLRNRTPIPSEIVGACSSLVIIERVEPRHGYDREVLQLAYFSVQQYLRSEQVDPAWKHCLSETQAKASNAKLCLAYCFELERYGDDYDGLDYDDEFLEELPFTNTSARQWPHYAMQIEAQDESLKAMIQEFFLSDELERARLNWLHLKDIQDHLVPNREWHTEWFRTSPEKLVPLTIASACGLYHSVQLLLVRGADPNASCPVWGSALYAAAYGGHENIVLHLLECGAKPNPRSGCAELSAAISSPSSSKRFEIFHALLQCGADVNACDEIAGLPLVAAVARDDENIINMLLNKGAHINAVDNQQRNAIRVAAARDNDKIVRELLANGAEVNSIGKPNGTALVSACLGGHKRVIRTLLKNGANIRQLWNGQFRDALHAVSFCGDEEIFQLLLTNDADIEYFDKEGIFDRCLTSACDRGNYSIAETLLKDYKANMYAHNSGNSTSLIAASDHGHDDVVRLLLGHGADIHRGCTCGSQHSSLGTCALFWACRSGHEGVINTLLDHGVDVNAQGGSFDTVLVMACWLGDEKLAELLLARGANVNQVGNRYGTALILACVRRQESIVRRLVAYGADLNQAATSMDWYGNLAISRTPLLGTIYVASPFQTQPLSGNEITWLRIMKFLLDNGADVNKPDDQGQTPLHYAAVSRSTELTEILIKAHAFVDAVDEEGQTPLIKAAEVNAVGRVEVLFKAGARTDIQDSDGKTALHHAAERGWLEICMMLVDAGSKIGSLDNSGLDPLHLAEREDQTGVIEFLSRIREKDLQRLGGLDEQLPCQALTRPPEQSVVTVPRYWADLAIQD